MALSTTHVTGAARFMFKIGSTDYFCDVTDFKEIESKTGGEVLDTACGTIRNPVASTITGATMSIVQGLQTAQLWQYLRQNTSAGTEVATWVFGTSYTGSATNPKWTATLTGWTTPPAVWTRGPIPTSPVEFSFSAAPVVAFS